MKQARTLLQRLMTCLIWLAACASRAMAQATPPPPGDGPAISSGRSWYFEALIVVVMFSVALYVVCRSSRRN